MNFNLLDEDWIPVLYRDGTWKRVGIRTALQEAHKIRQIAASNPMDRVAILRFMLALLYWCKGSPPENESIQEVKELPWKWFAKLEEHRESFNLFGEGKRFFQNLAYRRHSAEHTTSYLIHEIPSGTNKWHFRHSTDKENGLCAACCAMGLIRMPMFATQGGKGMTAQTGKSPGVNAKPPVYAFSLGQCLAETLLCAWKRIEGDLGTPAWEDAAIALPSQGEVPLLTGLTWLPRSVWLDAPNQTDSACISCGRTEKLIRLCVFDGKGSSKTEGRIWRDPHVFYRVSSKGKVTPLYAGDAIASSDAASGQWSDIVQEILRSDSNASRAWVVGYATDQDKYLEAMEFTFEKQTPRELMEQALNQIERWRKHPAALVAELKKAIRSPKEDKKRTHAEIPPLLASIRPHIEKEIFASAGELLGSDTDQWQNARDSYRPLMNAVARSLFSGFSTEAIRRRTSIKNVAPDMRPPAEARKARSKKGGAK